ncbi:MAG: ABC transporter substrate-binding protein [Chloroflexota bacterium]
MTTTSVGEGRISRRSALQGMGVTALGIAGAALLGCGDSNASSVQRAVVAAGKAGSDIRGRSLPMVAPVVQGTKRPGGTVTQSTGPTTYVQHDPRTALAASEWHLISDKCVELDAITRAIQPSVLTSWEVADPNGLTLTLKVRPGLKIHNVPPWNGRDFDAFDVAWNLERMGLFPKQESIPVAAFQRASMVANLTKAVAVDPQTVKVTLSTPNSAFFAGLGDPRMMLMPKEMDQVGYNDAMKLGSMGPYQIAEYTKDVRERLTKFPQYWRAGEPTFDEVVMQTIPDASSAEAAFESGQIQMISPVPSRLSTIQQQKPDANLYTWVDSNWEFLRPVMTYAPFKDVRVRQALHLATDYADIGNGYYGPGWAYQAAFCAGFPEAWSPDKVKSLAGYNPDTKANDRADAAKLLEAAGFPQGKGIDFLLEFADIAPSAAANATRFQTQMQQVFTDIKVRVASVDLATLAMEQTAGRCQMVSYMISANSDAVPEMNAQYHTVAPGGSGYGNYGGFSNRGLDTLIEKAQAELNHNTRAQLLDQFQQRWVDEWRPLIVLHANPAVALIQGDICGYEKSAGTWHGYGDWTRIREWYYAAK